MFTIITKKRWKRMLEENRQIRETLSRYDDAMRKLIRRIDRIEKDVAVTAKETRITKNQLKKIEKQKPQK